jgi:hypothetical protein
MPPVFDDYGDYSVESAPTTIVHVGSINSFMHVAHDRDALCDSYIVSSIMMLLKVIMREGNMI